MAVQGEDDVLDKLLHVVLDAHAEDELGHVVRLGLQQVEQVLVPLELVARLLVERLEAALLGALALHLLHELGRGLDDVLERRAVLDQQGDLDVEGTELLLAVVVVADVVHDLLLEALELQLFVKVAVAVVEQVQEALDRVDGRVVQLDKVLVLPTRGAAAGERLDLDDLVDVLLVVVLHRADAAAHEEAEAVGLDLLDHALVLLPLLQAVLVRLAGEGAAHVGLEHGQLVFVVPEVLGAVLLLEQLLLLLERGRAVRRCLLHALVVAAHVLDRLARRRRVGVERRELARQLVNLAPLGCARRALLVQARDQRLDLLHAVGEVAAVVLARALLEPRAELAGVHLVAVTPLRLGQRAA
eukprot:Unigene2357_Nuclearia_a/m.7273 Unigene2357_Nuclearia_a/g.7273  ORF Unigene2357_Nuclearia_a/g.7273 Unigene2357_Nuclearia_a/m.7273 type:complete len:357 (+) Unigene2357_Nuclearia_a:2067-3137(+)